jgi:hypothetical protein
MNMGKLVGGAVLLVVLSGCSAASSIAPSEPEPSGAVASAEPTVKPSPAPLVVGADAPTAAPTPTASGVLDGGEAMFVAQVRDSLYGLESVTDEQLIAAGWYTCEQIDAGAKRSTLVALSGESGSEPAPGMNNATVMFAAIGNLCVEHNNTDTY